MSSKWSNSVDGARCGLRILLKKDFMAWHDCLLQYSSVIFNMLSSTDLLVSVLPASDVNWHTQYCFSFVSSLNVNFPMKKNEMTKYIGMYSFIYEIFYLTSATVSWYSVSRCVQFSKLTLVTCWNEVLHTHQRCSEFRRWKRRAQLHPYPLEIWNDN